MPAAHAAGGFRKEIKEGSGDAAAGIKGRCRCPSYACITHLSLLACSPRSFINFLSFFLDQSSYVRARSLSPVAELHAGQRGPWPPLALQILHVMNSDFLNYCSKRVAPPHSSKFEDQAPPLSLSRGAWSTVDA